MVRVVPRRCAVALVTLALLGWPFQAVAQPSSLPPNVIAPSAENSVIRNQLVLARKFEQQALQGYMALSADNSVSIDPMSYQAARDAYILIRAARHGKQATNTQRIDQHFLQPHHVADGDHRKRHSVRTAGLGVD